MGNIVNIINYHENTEDTKNVNNNFNGIKHYYSSYDTLFFPDIVFLKTIRNLKNTIMLLTVYL